MNNYERGFASWSDPLSLQYHTKQWAEQKESTKNFNKFFQNELKNSTRVIDLGAGAGAATYFLSQNHPKTHFIGVDQSEKLIDIANGMQIAKEAANLRFEVGNWFDLRHPQDSIDGVVSLQTLSWLPELEAPMSQIFLKIKPKWIGLSSLFYDGGITCKFEVHEHIRERKTFYNVYSLKELNRFANSFGYEVTRSKKFNLEIDLPKPKNLDLMGTYTERVQRKIGFERLQISGPLLLNWKFVLISRIKNDVK